ncbi:MAG: helix-turn-helix domain-containing protein [Burkholderiaceae bacterium]|nr:helix-turn-helix domain-containing protein [Burkholderiaceae bacterium]MDO9089434.1 helix-turn-helix domain-containing protein [Burkholderiaceae bacterium]
MLIFMPSKAPLLFPNQVKQLRELGERLREARLRRRFPASLVAKRADLSRPTLTKVEQGEPAVTMGTYLRVMAVLGLDKDLGLLAASDPVGRRLQDAELTTPRRAPKTRKAKANPDETLDGRPNGRQENA